MSDHLEFLNADQCRAILRTSLDGFFVLDAAGRLLDANDAYCRMTGFSREELLKMHVTDLSVDESPEQTERHLAHILREGTGRFESRHRRKDGGFVFVDVSVSRVEEPEMRIVVFLRDISERRKLLADLQESEEKFTRIFNSSANLIVFTEPESGRIVEVNDTWVRTTGISRHEAKGKTALELCLWPDQATRSACLTAFRLQGQLRDYQTTLRPKGVEFPVLVSAVYVEVRGSRYILWEFRDMVRQKEAERSQELLRAQLAQAQKMETVGRLAGGVAHDFNNLLTVINGYSDRLLSRLPEGDTMRRSVEEIRQAGGRAAAMTQQLLAFSRRQLAEPRVMNLNASVAETERLLNRLIGEDVQLVLALEPNLGAVYADPIQVNQVLMNLAINARDAMPQGGTLTLETANVNIGGAEFVRLTVRDTGVGMDEETQGRLFEPFFTTKPEGTGTGLGLSTTYGIVKQAGGRIMVNSQPGRGTAFEVYLPRAASEDETVAHEEAARTEAGETVLVVEDQPSVREYTAVVLRDLGYQVLAAESGVEALAVSASHAGPIHLVLTDVIMPGMSGRTLADRIRPQRPEARILYMTGYAGEALKQRGLPENDAPCLPKPFSPEELAAKVRESLDRAGKSRTVLVVDDEAPVRRLLRETLTEAGYAVLEAEHGDAALDVLSSKPVDVMITDLVMPQKEGLETIAEARKRFPGVKIVSMSGAFGGQYLRVASLMGADAKIAKPIDPEELLKTVQGLV